MGKRIIKESLSKIVYHFTTIANAYYIMKNNTLLLSNANPGSADVSLNRGKNYYVSFTRNKNSFMGYANSKNNKNGKYFSYDFNTANSPTVTTNIQNGSLQELSVRFEFDGEKLNTKFKGTQADTIYQSYNQLMNGGKELSEAFDKDAADDTIETPSNASVQKNGMDSEDWNNIGPDKRMAKLIQMQNSLSDKYGDPNLKIGKKHTKMLKYGIDPIHSTKEGDRNILSRENETEDRIISNSPCIHDIYDYVTRVDILLPQITEENRGKYIKIYKYAKSIYNLTSTSQKKTGKDTTQNVKVFWKDKVHFFNNDKDFNFSKPDNLTISDIENVLNGESNNTTSEYVTKGAMDIASQMIFWISYQMNKNKTEKAAAVYLDRYGLNGDVTIKYGKNDSVVNEGKSTEEHYETVNFKDYVLSRFSDFQQDVNDNKINTKGWGAIKKYFKGIEQTFHESTSFIRNALMEMIQDWLNKYKKAVTKKGKQIEQDILSHPEHIYKYINMVNKGTGARERGAKKEKKNKTDLWNIFTTVNDITKNIKEFIKVFLNAQYNYDELIYFQKEVIGVAQDPNKQRHGILTTLHNYDAKSAGNYLYNLNENDIRIMVAEAVRKIIETKKSANN